MPDPSLTHPNVLWVLTPGESLFMVRRQLGLTQAEAARRGRTTRTPYQKAEGGLKDDLARDLVKRLGYGRTVLLPTASAFCVLARRRSGLETATIAASIGVSRMRLYVYERDGHPRLVDYWRGRGFEFPFA